MQTQSSRSRLLSSIGSNDGWEGQSRIQETCSMRTCVFFLTGLTGTEEFAPSTSSSHRVDTDDARVRHGLALPQRNRIWFGHSFLLIGRKKPLISCGRTATSRFVCAPSGREPEGLYLVGPVLRLTSETDTEAHLDRRRAESKACQNHVTWALIYSP